MTWPELIGVSVLAGLVRWAVDKLPPHGRPPPPQPPSPAPKQVAVEQVAIVKWERVPTDEGLRKAIAGYAGLPSPCPDAVWAKAETN